MGTSPESAGQQTPERDTHSLDRRKAVAQMTEGRNGVDFVGF